MNQGRKIVEGRVNDLVAEHKMDLEHIFLKIIGCDPAKPSIGPILP